MSEVPPSNVVDIHQFKLAREEQREIEELHYFEMDLKGRLTFDGLDDLIDFIKDLGITPETFLFDEEDLKKDQSGKPQARAND